MTVKVVFVDPTVLSDRAWRRSFIDAYQKPGAQVGWWHEKRVAAHDPARVARLQRLCDAAGAYVVVLSYWCSFTTHEETVTMLRELGLRAPVLASITADPGADRGALADSWLAANAWLAANPTGMRSVDLASARDAAVGTARASVPMVAIDGAEGLGDEHVTAALDLLVATCRCPLCVRAEVRHLWSALRTFPAILRVACVRERPGRGRPLLVRWGWA